MNIPMDVASAFPTSKFQKYNDQTILNRKTQTQIYLRLDFRVIENEYVETEEYEVWG